MMKEMLKNIDEEWNIGDPAKLLYEGGYIYGRFYQNDTNSTYYNGKYAQLLFLTPAGTIIKTGRAYLSKLSSEEEDKLKYWEHIQMKKEDYMGLYSNKITLNNNIWSLCAANSVKNNEMQYEIVDDIVKIEFKRKKVPIAKYFKDYNYVEKLNEGVLSELLNKTLDNLEENYNILSSSITENINVLIKKPSTNDNIELFINKFLEELRNYYEENEVHITRMFGSYILLEKENNVLRAVKATPIPIKYCPLMIKLLKEVGGTTAEELLKTLNVEDEELQTKKMCELINEVVIKGGYFDSNRPLNSCEANVLFGASETMASAFDSNLIDAAVIVSNNLGTIITTNASNTQGAVKRMTGLFYTSPSAKIMKTAQDAGIIPVFPHTAEIDQIAGVKKAISLGYKKIAVSLAAGDNKLHCLLKEIEEKNNVKIYKFGLCSTGIDNKTAEIMGNNADIIWSCASKAVKEYVEPTALAQVGLKIPVHIMTKQGWEIVKNHLNKMNTEANLKETILINGDEKSLFLNENNSIKVLKKKQLGKCTDCPSPCV